MKAKKVAKFVVASIVALCSGIGLGIISNHLTSWIAEDLANWVNS